MFQFAEKIEEISEVLNDLKPKSEVDGVDDESDQVFWIVGDVVLYFGVVSSKFVCVCQISALKWQPISTWCNSLTLSLFCISHISLEYKLAQSLTAGSRFGKASGRRRNSAHWKRSTQRRTRWEVYRSPFPYATHLLVVGQRKSFADYKWGPWTTAVTMLIVLAAPMPRTGSVNCRRLSKLTSSWRTRSVGRLRRNRYVPETNVFSQCLYV